ncbi:MAG: hypothetical protein OXH86_09805 [Acidimicrobiaceae bacterium]|uniref:hypothetical protein n=1 Tax=Candidatus Palauibacter soopunensis TaxID=3056739 RepID=UPI002387D4C6|nr:hypothetical protein [Candidatus Palauibacter soopunensis]MDE0497637.1 hypothetical protein [Acidimicrobiaceae bacterium]MDE2878445.1 hypothetical protein [Candidatus Palauibacter soopunensis]
MFDLEAAFRDWRVHMARGGGLSACEVDELEDHLRAHVDLELELDKALTPARAFALARYAIGEPKTLSREFAKAGKPRWRHLLRVGGAMFAASWVLPAVGDTSGHLWGWEAFLLALEWGNPGEAMSALSSVLMLLALFVTRRVRRAKLRWLTWCVTGAAVLNLLYWIPSGDLAVGYWAWAGSFVCASSALWMRARERASIKLRQAPVRPS